MVTLRFSLSTVTTNFLYEFSSLRVETTTDSPRKRRCNCRDKTQWPKDGNCQISSIVYKVTVQVTGEDRQKEQIGLTKPEFKKRHSNHPPSFRQERHEKSTELSKCVWNLKRQNSEYSLGWSVIAQTPGYSNITKLCPLCLREKLEILQANKRVNMNKRSELVSKCRYENKYYLSKFSPSAVTKPFHYPQSQVRCCS